MSAASWDEIFQGIWSNKLWKPFVILLLCWGLFLALKFGLKRLEAAISRKEVLREEESILRLKTFLHVLKWLGSIFIVCFGLYELLENFGIDVAPLLAGAGIVGLAFGFGGQYLIRDLINGIFILLEGQFRVNDVVKIGELGGLVESMNLRVTQLRDLEGRVIYIPNGEIKTVINFTKGHSQALLDVGIAYKEKVDDVMRVMKEIAQ
ncbi:MAG TPA: mechanosensitive ion channel, partial [Candidatus Omnitrophota bacterium]|nr:mechanosensitive ion channel [Candidatus Omnitrophota bacterium]